MTEYYMSPDDEELPKPTEKPKPKPGDGKGK